VLSCTLLISRHCLVLNQLLASSWSCDNDSNDSYPASLNRAVLLQTMWYFIRAYFTWSIWRIMLDQTLRSSHAMNLAFGTWWADHPPSPFKVPLRYGLAALWKWRVQGHSYCARRPIVHVHVHSFLILKNCRMSASISSNEKALRFTPYGPITHAEQARVSQKGACSLRSQIAIVHE
jgi:hypothetical protein